MKKKWCKDGECPYFQKVEVPYSGTLKTDIVIVGESPGTQEIERQQPFVGPSGQVLNALIESIGYSRSNVLVTNACRCLLDKEENLKVQNAALAHCRAKLVKAIQKAKPKLIITLGAVALKQILKLQKIMENRGRFFYSEEFGCQVLVTVHPAYVLRGASRKFWEKSPARRTMKENLLFVDFEQGLNYLKSGETESNGIAEAVYVEGTAKDAKELKKAKTLAVDFETTGLDLENPNCRVLSVAMCAEPGKATVFMADKKGKLPKYVLDILKDPKITKLVAARPFEERVCRSLLGIALGGSIHDVLVMAHLLDENYHSYSLEAVADIYTPLKGIKGLAQGQRASLEELLKEDRKAFITYNAADTDATLRAFRAMQKHYAQDKKLARYYASFMKKIQDMFADIYYNGCRIDMERLGLDEMELTQRMEQLTQECIEMLPASIKEKYASNLKITRPIIVQEYLFTSSVGLRLQPNPAYLTPKTRKPQLSEDHLKQFTDIIFIQKFLEMKKIDKILGTYLHKYPKFIKPDGRVYPSTLLTQTVTGRTVMKEPTIQTIPQRSHLAKYAKRCFAADKGWLLGGRDLGQSEIRIMGWIAKDPNILGALEEGIDIHTKTAAVVNRVPVSKVTKRMRQRAKGVNFGFLYGMGAWKFRTFAKHEYGQDFTEQECEKIRTAFFAYPDGYYMLPRYHRRQEMIVARDAIVRSPLGRIRRLPDGQSRDLKSRREAARQAINFPIQSFSSDLGLIGMYLFWDELKKRKTLAKNVRAMWFIHDAVYFQAKEKHMKQAMALLKDCMENKAKDYVKQKFGVTIGYPITSDGKVGPNWAELQDYED